MPSPERAHCNQRAVLWEKTGDDMQGQPILTTPVEIPVRWVDVYREITRKDGTPLALTADLISLQSIPLGSLVWLGELEAWYGTGSAGYDDDLYQVQTGDRTPDVKNRSDTRNRVVQYSNGLSRWMGTLPTAI